VDEHRLDELVEVAVEHPVYVPDLQFGPRVLDEAIGLEDVGPDLVAPGDFGFEVLHLIDLLPFLFLLELIKAGGQHLHTHGLVLVLGAFVLALDDDPGRVVGDPDGGIGCVDVLAALARRAVRIDPDIFGIDVDFDRVINFGIGENGGEGGVASLVGVERRDANQPVDACLLTQVAEGELPFDPDRGALQTRLLTRCRVENLGLEAFPLGVAQVHPEQDLGPILGLGPSGPGMDSQDGVPGIVHIKKKGSELGFGQLLLKNVQGLGDVIIDVLSLLGEFQENSDLFLLRIDLVEELEIPFEPLLVLLEGLGRLLILPSLGVGEPAVQGIEFSFFTIEVKENLEVPRT